MMEFIVTSKKALIAFEACGGSHYWARFCERHGHDVKVISSYRVKPFAPAKKKNDAVDAEAIAIAAQQVSVPSTRTKSTDQQDIEIMQNYREQIIAQRVALMNQLHAIALEYGVSLPSCKSFLQIEKIVIELENGDNELTDVAREMISRILVRAKNLNAEAESIALEIASFYKGNENYKLICSIPGVGPQTAAAVLAHTGGNVSSFKNGRQFSAYLGLTPQQYSTGGKSKLLGITKTGNERIRRLLIVGMNSVLRVVDKKQDKVSLWASEKKSHKAYRVTAVAMANKTARIIYAVLKNQTPYCVA
jgi:transposase